MNKPAKVKPLVWSKRGDAAHWIARNPFGECWIKQYVVMGKFDLYGPGHYGPGNSYDTLEEAKAAAQEGAQAAYERLAHYDRFVVRGGAPT